MEVHHHSHHPKKWKEYITEFLMLFLAVTLGFLAENLREVYVEKERSHELILQLQSDIKNNIKLSVGVYPWPGQILYDTKESKQVKIWQDFCTNKCDHFYNSFPSLFKLVDGTSKKEVIANYYFKGDIHFNEAGNKLIATDFLETYQAGLN